MIKFIGEKRFDDIFFFRKYGIFYQTDNWNSLNLTRVTDLLLSEACETVPSVYLYINDLGNSDDSRSFFTNFLLPSIIVDIAIEKSIPFIFFSISLQKLDFKNRSSLKEFLNPKNSAESSAALLNQYARHRCEKFFQTYFSHVICNSSNLRLLLETDDSTSFFSRFLVKSKNLNTQNVKSQTLTSLLLDNNSNFLISEYGALILREEHGSN